MTPMRWIYAAFWIFIAVALIGQLINYNNHLNQVPASVALKQQHFVFLPPSSATSNPAPAPKPDGADVHQVGFSVDRETPPGSFTYHVVLKNEGTMKAVGVEVEVVPFRGAMMGNPDGGRSKVYAVSDSDAIAQISQSVSFPDLAPGESCTRDAVFLNQAGYNPSSNPRPQIQFMTEKPKADSSGPVFPKTL